MPAAASDKFARLCCERIAGPEPTNGEKNAAGIGAPDWTALIQVIAEILVSLLSDCPANDARIADAAKNPTFWQRARFAALVDRKIHGRRRLLFWSRDAANIADAITQTAAEQTPADLLAIAYEVRRADWLVI